MPWLVPFTPAPLLRHTLSCSSMFYGMSYGMIIDELVI